ncbi:MAG: hypothetical protein COA78_26185 [Blastopirellula sp.]|nr:MAG: hypothetical protein COA78_26185 [Blastopirellula sp.]
MSTNYLTKTGQAEATSLKEMLLSLHSVKFSFLGTKKKTVKTKVLTDIFSHLATLLENGVTLPKALLAISGEASLWRQKTMLLDLLHAIERGASFSVALAEHPDVFSELMVHQIRIGEKSGAVATVLRRISLSLEDSNQLRRKIIKRLSYPAVVTFAGVSVSIFMILFIVPVFEETYKKSNMKLPFATQFLIDTGNVLTNYGWLIALLLMFAVYMVRRIRKDEHLGAVLDEKLLRVPLLGPWLRDYAMLQFMDTLGTMLQSGYKLADALAYCSGSVSNKAVNKAVESISQAILRGERLSNEMNKHQDLFSPVVSQLVIIGEQTGTLARASEQVREHLKKDIERKTDAVVSTLEPVLTLMMAFMIGGILLAIYTPMFGMLDLVDQ